MALKKNPKADLKLHYKRTFEVSLIIALAFLVIAFKFFPEFKNEEIKNDAPQELVNVEDVEITKQQTAPPPPPKPPILIEAPSDEDVLDDIEIQDTELDENAEVTAPPPPPPSEEEEEETMDFFQAVEKMPTPVGGINAIRKKLVYPDLAKRAGVQGQVIIKAYVDKRGIVQKVEVMKGIGAGCDEEAMKAVKSTRFIPGEQRGKAVPVQVSVPVRFTLQ